MGIVNGYHCLKCFVCMFCRRNNFWGLHNRFSTRLSPLTTNALYFCTSSSNRKSISGVRTKNLQWEHQNKRWRRQCFLSGTYLQSPCSFGNAVTFAGQDAPVCANRSFRTQKPFHQTTNCHGSLFRPSFSFSLSHTQHP